GSDSSSTSDSVLKTAQGVQSQHLIKSTTDSHKLSDNTSLSADSTSVSLTGSDSSSTSDSVLKTAQGVQSQHLIKAKGVSAQEDAVPDVITVNTGHVGINPASPPSSAKTQSQLQSEFSSTVGSQLASHQRVVDYYNKYRTAKGNNSLPTLTLNNS
ncbi:hypothetical protein OGZ43_13130, partial [Lactococcus lactis]|nr:hypothetical protein [Lactococcus lactis]MDG5103975.1 hypothetical protein [Lactococcus lactis]